MTQERYPLSWPTGWRRTPAAARNRAQFSKRTQQRREWRDATGALKVSTWSSKSDLSVSEATRRLTEKLRRLGVDGDDFILSTNLQVRLDGLPRSNQRDPGDPGVAVYFRLAGKDRCLASDRWDRVADNIAAIAAHIEALRAIERYGIGTIDQAFAGYTALPATTDEWWIVLGVKPNDGTDIITTRFRELARTHHPDRGGDPNEMVRINAAYEAFKKERGL